MDVSVAAFATNQEQSGVDCAGQVLADETVTASSGACYFSPVARLDPETEQVVLLYRDPDTGEVLSQYPSKKQLEEYRQAQMFADDSGGVSGRDVVRGALLEEGV